MLCEIELLKYQVVSTLLFHILPPVSQESVYRAITVKAPQIYVFQSPDRCSFQNSHSNLIKSRLGNNFLIKTQHLSYIISWRYILLSFHSMMFLLLNLWTYQANDPNKSNLVGRGAVEIILKHLGRNQRLWMF